MTNEVEFTDIEKSYRTPAGVFQALQPLSLRFAGGEFVGITGRSGSGKSTLLNLLSGITRPSAGEAVIAGENIGRLSETRLAEFRGRHIGIVFQFFQLIPTLTVLENILLAMDLVGVTPRRERHPRALDLLEQVGVVRQKDKLPARLSGGEQQRVAIARALANNPGILIADEPTGNLDSNNSELIMAIFENCARAGRLVIVATHQPEQQVCFSRMITLSDGVLHRDTSAASSAGAAAAAREGNVA